MATKKTAKKSSGKAQTLPEAPTLDEAVKNDELVAEAAINMIIPEEPKAKKSAPTVSSYVTVINTSYNPICLTTWEKGHRSVTIAPKEIKQILRDDYRDYMKNKIVRAWFDKGILTSNADANETDANEAKAPEELKNPVERTDGVSTVSATVKKFKKESPITINL